MRFLIPEMHYRKSKASKVVMVTMPKLMKGKLKEASKKTGWSFAHLIDLVLDQYFYALKGRKTLFEHEYRFVRGDKENTPLRLDNELYKEVKEWAEGTNQSPSQVICLALDMYLCQR